MDCPSTRALAIMMVEGVKDEDVRLGQLVMLATALSIALLYRVLSFVF